MAAIFFFLFVLLLLMLVVIAASYYGILKYLQFNGPFTQSIGVSISGNADTAKRMGSVPILALALALLLKLCVNGH